MMKEARNGEETSGNPKAYAKGSPRTCIETYFLTCILTFFLTLLIAKLWLRPGKRQIVKEQCDLGVREGDRKQPRIFDSS